MKILVNNKWRGGFLDYYGSPKEYRLKVLTLKNLEKLEGLYFVRPKSVKLVLNYLIKFGLIAVLRKIRSRLSEQYRNEKYVSYGIGLVMESPTNGKFAPEEMVGFVAPLHPALVERIVLPEEFLVKMAEFTLSQFPSETIYYQSLNNITSYDDVRNYWWKEIRGWSIYSGIKLPKQTLILLKDGLENSLKNTDWNKSELFEIKTASPISETKLNLWTSDVHRLKQKEKSAVLFGYGNYAKTTILPNIKPYLDVQAVHEIDPTQIFFAKNFEKLDASPYPRPEEKYDAYLIAGYHHTHAPLAIHALNKNAYALVEKPITTDKNQLKELLTAMEKTKAGIFVGFHKRYSPFNKLAMKDLDIKAGDPVSYHCIVYEVPQPALYWYNWPSSKSPLVSNGCHWIDHFLYLNNFGEPRSFDVFVAKDGTINVSIELRNGAVFTMAFTDKGSNYIGVQDYVELRTKNATAKIINDSQYVSENEKGIIRRKKINKMENYKIMYSEIGKKIAANEKGDSLKSVKISGGLILALEDKLRF